MNTFVSFARGFGFAALALLPGCSSSSSNGPGSSSTFSTGLPPSQSLGTISDADLKTLCASAASFSSGFAGGNTACSIAGISAAAIQQLLGSAKTDADLQKACTDAETACQKAPAGDAGTTTTQTCKKPSASCTATIGEYEACVNDSYAAFKTESAKVPTCATLTAADLQTPEGGSGVVQTTQPASCKVVATKCPDAP